MSFTEAVSSAFARYSDFTGRASRSEYWWFVLFNLLLGIAIGMVGAMVLGPTVTNVVGLIINLALIIPSISVAARRLHDINRSGWWQLLAFTGIGIILLLIWYVREGDQGTNEHGEPRTAGANRPAFNR